MTSDNDRPEAEPDESGDSDPPKSAISLPRRILIAGLGNVLLGDDAIGPLVIAHLEATYDFPEHVEVVDLGTPGLNLQPWLSDLAALVLIDAVRASAPPGSIEVFDRESLLSRPPPPRVSPHDLGLKESLRLAELAEGRPIPVFLVGISVAQTEQGAPMTAAVAEAVEPTQRTVLSILKTLDAYPKPAESSREVRAWWCESP